MGCGGWAHWQQPCPCSRLEGFRKWDGAPHWVLLCLLLFMPFWAWGIQAGPFLLLPPGALCPGNSLIDLGSANHGYLGNTSWGHVPTPWLTHSQFDGP